MVHAHRVKLVHGSRDGSRATRVGRLVTNVTSILCYTFLVLAHHCIWAANLPLLPYFLALQSILLLNNFLNLFALIL